MEGKQRNTIHLQSHSVLPIGLRTMVMVFLGSSKKIMLFEVQDFAIIPLYIKGTTYDF